MVKENIKRKQLTEKRVREIVREEIRKEQVRQAKYYDGILSSSNYSRKK